MYNLPAPTINDEGEYDYVCGTRSTASRASLAPLRPGVMGAYGTYKGCTSTTIQCLPPVPHTEEQKALLRGNYRRLDVNQACSGIRSQILAAARQGQCPYCRLTEATSLDHILEQGEYPEFAVLRPNIAPVCVPCNTKKQNNSTAVAHLPRFHLYLTQFPVARYLFGTVTVTPIRVAYEFFIDKPPSVSTHKFEALTAHFEALELSDRYARRAVSELGDRIGDMRKTHASSGHPGVQLYLRRQADSVRLNWSHNDWRFVLLQAASDNPEYCDRGIFY